MWTIVTSTFIATGQKVKITPSGLNNSSGFLMGTVISSTDYVATAESIQKSVGSAQIASSIISSGASNSESSKGFVEVRISIDVDSSNVSGYKWSVKDPPNYQSYSYSYG